MLREPGVETDAFAATLLISEVASNAARYGEEPIELIISAEGVGLRVAVFDHGGGFDPGECVPRPDGGWGLRFVDALSTDWGVERRDGGTEVWFRV